jgi:hypothetical protein
VSADAIVWEDPPGRSARTQSIDFEALVGNLKAHPGKWAIVRTYGSPGGYGQHQARLKALGCEAVGRRTGVAPSTETTLYARWPEDVA